MNYIPLYRKYRPQKLEEIVGQEHIKQALKNAIELNKISHAYLFTGPRGTGKTSTARIFAKSLNCKNGPTISPCGTCENCIDIANSTPIDVIEIDAASNRKVEDAQNILERVMYAPVNSRYKIYIIDEVHMLSSTAFNALLKTLEEPPANVVFILATTEVHKVLDTIKSRCQRFDFKRITTDDIVKHLRDISDKESINITDDALSTIAKNSAGGMRDSIALLDQLSVLSSKNAITTDDINNLLGRISFDILKSLTDQIINSNPQSALEILENIYNSGNEPVQILSNLMDYFKNLLIVKNSTKEIALELTQINDIQLQDTKTQTETLETHQIISLIDKCSEYIKELKLTNNPRLWLEVAVIDLANLTENTKLAQLQERITILESGNIQHSKNAAYKTAPMPVTKPEILKPNIKQEMKTEIQNTNDNEIKTHIEENKNNPNEEFSPMPKAKEPEGATIHDLWVQLLNTIKNAPVRALLKQWASPVKISPEETILAMKSEIFLKQVQSGAKYQFIADAVDEIFSQKSSNVTVRLASPDDEKIEQPVVEKTAKPEKKFEQSTTSIETVDTEELESLKTEANKDGHKIKDADTLAASIHSDNVKMAIDLFEGKVID